MKSWAIIVAGGSGLRMKHRLRKQYLPLAGKPVLSHTLQAFLGCEQVHAICLVVPQDDIDFCRQQLIPALSEKEIRLVFGGQERQDSVYNGLCAVDAAADDMILIHDGVRPFVSSELISDCIAGAAEFGACIPGISAFDTLKQVTEAGYIEKTLDRQKIWLAQTPQAFRYDLIRNAHDIAKADGIIGTDDASLIERLGQSVKIIPGSRLNIKITSPEDLLLAKAILSFGFESF
jgi:2-C-methyl-D-erythritol 4-phosphate cytidylyltransferase